MLTEMVSRTPSWRPVFLKRLPLLAFDRSQPTLRHVFLRWSAPKKQRRCWHEKRMGLVARRES